MAWPTSDRATLKSNPHWNNVGKNEEDEGRLKDDLPGIQGDNSIDSGRFWATFGAIFSPMELGMV